MRHCVERNDADLGRQATMLNEMSKTWPALALAMFATGCHGDASMSKEIVGTWSWRPHDELPKEQVVEKGFPTPSLEAVKFTSDGRYVFVQRIPGYDSGVVAAAGPVMVPEKWYEWKGTWDITKGKLEMGTSDESWGALRREKGWATAGGPDGPTEWSRSFQVVELKSSELQLKAIAIADFDRTFHRAQAMPERPEVGKASQ